ncbi:M15 family metallopeptidase [Gordonia rubripertincta]|uniref:M15 family metallopeptidase n=1 Tax=Gordonia rubripertincta TaxID=36822 RepID=UPI0015FAB200|nr:M15 family metallopeptidase [Gordonia rubripertincta]QMU22087.1 M15 family metallopeptidase [Gordonia rubripertincta]
MSFRNAYGYSHSENGWRMCNRDACTVITVGGMSVPVRAGWAAVALKAWMLFFHENVEAVNQYYPIDDWGWSRDNAVATSNHLSGTGIDLNATEHPWKIDASQNFTKGQIAEIRRGLREFEGNIFWGQDWGTRDPMHFQLGAGTAAGDGASAKLINFCQRRIDTEGRIRIGAAAPPPWTPTARDFEAFSQLGRF